MSWLTVLWSLAGSICLTLSVVHFSLWMRSHLQRANLLFSVTALSAAGVALCELMSMKATSIDAYALITRWAHLPIFALLVSLVWFVREYTGSGRRWLAVLFTGLWVPILLLNLISPHSVVYSEIHELQKHELFGEAFVIARGTTNPWQWLASAATVVLLVYFVDLFMQLRRLGRKRECYMIAGSAILFVVLAGIHTPLVDVGIIETPYMISFAFLAITVVMADELSRDVVRSLRLSQEVLQSERRWDGLLASIPMFVIGVDRQGRITYANSYLVQSLGFEGTALTGKPLQTLIPQERIPQMQAYLEEALGGRLMPPMEAPILTASGDARQAIWTTVTLRNAEGHAEGILGIGTDVTDRVAAERELQSKREELAHLTRVATVGELATSLAHELNQPLTAMSNNAAAGLQMIKRDKVDIAELSEILTDICADGQRAGSVIHGLRDMVRKQSNARADMELNRIVEGAITLTRPAASAVGCTLVAQLDPSNPMVMANAIQVEQVLLNLVVNALDAMKAAATRDPCVIIETSHRDADIAVVEVRDNGPGLPPEAPSTVFEQFYSTKENGMGMGLSIARSIIEAHHGRLQGENLSGGGARLWFTLPQSPQPAP